MHILATQTGTIDDGEQAIDLAQDPADIVVLSAADSELAALARAHDGLGPRAPSLRVANLMQLGHNYSVDLYIERTLAHARLVVLRLLGGAAYWPYGIKQVEAVARARGIMLAVLPGDAQPDETLVARSTMDESGCLALWRYLVEGGPDNISNFLKFCAHQLGHGDAPPGPVPLARAGFYWPGEGATMLQAVTTRRMAHAPVAVITFYRALIEGGNTAPVDALVEALEREGIAALPVFVSSLKEEAAHAVLSAAFAAARPSIVLNATGFAIASASGARDPFADLDCPVLQVVFAGSSRKGWRENARGLSARDLAMNVVLPELDGRVLTRAVSFKSSAERHEGTQCHIVTYEPEPDRIAFTAKLAANWVRLRSTPAEERRVALILANYPNKDGRIGNGVGYDTPESTVALLRALKAEGYNIGEIPADGTALMEWLRSGPTNAPRRGDDHANAPSLSLDAYRAHFACLPEKVRKEIEARWGAPEDDPFVSGGAFALPVRLLGNVAVAIQPARGYNIDPAETYHDPALVPPHGYLAFHIWLREIFGAHAVVHNGKHGNLEWLPGKALALSATCYPEAALGPVPNIYPFIVNDPGEGTQAKRRAGAVIIDHLTPPLTRAESYGPLKDLEALIDEYYLASGLDPKRRDFLGREILQLTRETGLDEDAGIADEQDDLLALQKLDAYICELKEAQIRDGLHVLGQAPEGRLETDLLVALTRIPRGQDVGGGRSLIRALAADLGLDGFDPLDCAMEDSWTSAKPDALAGLDDSLWRTAGDTVERLELLAAALVSGEFSCDPAWAATRAVLDEIAGAVRPALIASAESEIANTLRALSGRFVEPGPSGAPTRGRLDVLPTGRNFFSIDNRTLPTPAAWTLGQASADRLVERDLQDHGRWLRAIALTAWGTSNMRTGGDDIAQALALIGAKPKWDTRSWRVTGFEIIPLAKLGRPRVDVTLRISGFFRDAFPTQIDLFDSAVRAIGRLEEDEADNPIAAHMARELASLEASGVDAREAERRAGFRVFGSKPGAYGAGLQALIDERLWKKRSDLAESFIGWGGYAYGGGAAGEERKEDFARRLGQVEAVIHNQDNREHDLLDSDDYYQFEGGMTAAVEYISGTRPAVYHNDHSRPHRPVIRTLEEEIGRVVRSRVVNPKWIAGVMRHGYKGAFEIAATVDYMFAFAATTGAVKHHHFELAYDAFIADNSVRDFIAEHNPDALSEIAARFREAIERGLWRPRSNFAHHELETLQAARKSAIQEETVE